jgi:hypothetical protein
LASSNSSQMSVRSLAGSPPLGSIWMRSEIGTIVSYCGSSSRPSMRSGVVARTARIVIRPCASRAIVSGRSGAGGPS